MVFTPLNFLQVSLCYRLCPVADLLRPNNDGGLQ